MFPRHWCPQFPEHVLNKLWITQEVSNLETAALHGERVYLTNTDYATPRPNHQIRFDFTWRHKSESGKTMQMHEGGVNLEATLLMLRRYGWAQTNLQNTHVL